MTVKTDIAPDLTCLPEDLQEQILALLAHKDDMIRRLEGLVRDYKQALFGAKSEKADPDQYGLAFDPDISRGFFLGTDFTSFQRHY